MSLVILVPILAVVAIFLAGIQIVRPTRRALIERLGKYDRFAEPGFHWIIPGFDRLYLVDTTEHALGISPSV